MSQRLEKFVSVVEDGIRLFGVDPAAAKGDKFGEWFLQRGTATVVVKINTKANTSGERDVLVILSVLSDVPKNNKEALFQKLLEENHKLLNERFSIYNNMICLVASRDMEGLDSAEVRTMINDQSFAADLLDEKVQGFVAANS